VKKELYSGIEINATPDRVWRVLTDFITYPIWNPFIREVRGNAATGQKLRVFLKPSGSRGMVFKPTVLKAECNREFRWLGKLFFSGLFDGEHYFRIEPIDEHQVKFVQGEIFTGILVRLFAKNLDTDTLRGFNEMNEALKKRAEG
jgi:hypothetical protein